MIYVFNKTHTLFNYEHYINFQTIYSKLNSNFYFFISQNTFESIRTGQKGGEKNILALSPLAIEVNNSHKGRKNPKTVARKNSQRGRILGRNPAKGACASSAGL